MGIRMIFDGLVNALTGMGGGNDARTGNRYCFRPLTFAEIEAAYRGSGTMRKVVDIPALDMTREWRDWQAEDDQIEAIEAEERRLGLQAKVWEAEILRGLGGGALVLIGNGNPEQPIGEREGKDSLRAVVLLNRWRLTGEGWIDDIGDPAFGSPKMWKLAGTSREQRIHPSRVVAFRADPLPDFMTTTGSWDDRFWGESRVQRVLDAVQNSDAAQAAFAGLIAKARNTVIGIPKLLEMVSTEDGESLLAKRMAAFGVAESLYNVTLKDNGDGSEGSGESVDHHEVTWTGIPDIVRVFAEAVASGADIPMTRLWGRAAEGMNASGDSQQRDWNKMVAARQRLFLQPCLDQTDAALIPSALGSRPDDVWWQFAPLDTPTEKEEAETFKAKMEAIEKLQNTGAIPDQAFAKGLQNTIVEGGWMPGLEGALAEIPESERFGIEEKENEPGELAIETMQERGAITAEQADALVTDARPRTLYVSRKLINGDEFVRWAKAQGFETTTPADDLHVTITFSRKPVDWLKMGSPWDEDEKGRLTVKPGGARIVERLGDKGAVVLMFSSSSLSWRHEEMIRNGASHDFDEYQPHVTITYSAPADLDLTTVEPFRGALVFGPEIFAEVVEDWEKTLEEA